MPHNPTDVLTHREEALRTTAAGMPKNSTDLLTAGHPFKQVVVPTRKGFQIAQGEGHKGPGGTLSSPEAAVHTATETEGHGGEPEAGEIPNAVLSLWNSATVILVLVVFALLARRALQRIPRGVGNLAEWIAESMNGFTTEIIGPGGRRYTPLVGTIFIYILLMNLIGIIPGFHSPTANLSITLALGMVVFFYVQYEGVRQNGIGGHLKHFAGPMLALSPLMFLIEVISEIVKPFTLAIRLFGNIFGEDVIIIVLSGLALQLGGKWLGWIPTQFPVLLLSILTALVQALVFSMLTCIYISLVSHHDHEGPHGEEGAVDGGHAGHAHGH